jgi:hypothetical protein
MGCLWATRLAQGANRLTDLWPQSLLSGTFSLLGDVFGIMDVGEKYGSLKTCD